jgi:O-antigen/teichoic acid export membrane protein
MADASPSAVSPRRAAADVAVQLVVRFGNLLLGMVVVVALTRGLGTEGFGRWAALTALVQIAGYLAEFGGEAAAVREAAQRPERRGTVLGALVVLRTILAVPATAASMLLCLALANGGDMAWAGVLLSLTILLQVPQALDSVFQLRVRNDVPMAILTLNSVLWTGAVVAFAVLDESRLVPFAIALAAIAVLTTGLQAVLALRAEPISLRGVGPEVRTLARVGIPIGIGALLTMAYVRIDQVLVLQLSGERDAGLYGAAYQLLDKAQFVPTALMTTLFPIIAATHATQPERLRRVVQLAGECLALASFPVVAFAIVASGPIVDVLYGDAFADAANALPILMAAFVTSSFGYLVGGLVVVTDAQQRFVAIAAVAVVLNVVANLLLLPEYGYLAAAWITFGTGVFVLLTTGWLAFSRLGVPPAPGTLPRTAVSAALMALAVWPAERAGANLAVLVTLGGAVYLLAVLATRAVRIAELRELLRERRPVDG